MDSGGAIAVTDSSMGPADLGQPLEERGSESLSAPAHSHTPPSRQSPFRARGELPGEHDEVR